MPDPFDSCCPPSVPDRITITDGLGTVVYEGQLPASFCLQADDPEPVIVAREEPARSDL